MTPQQQHTLNVTLLDIQQKLHDFTVPLLYTLDDLDANQLIATTRMKLHLIDLEFMSLYKLMATFVTMPRAPRPGVPTIDDLEI